MNQRIMIEINLVYGLSLAVLTLLLSGGLLFSIRESRDRIVFAQFLKYISYIPKDGSLIPEAIKPNSGHLLGFKLTIERRHFLKAIFPLFYPCHK